MSKYEVIKKIVESTKNLNEDDKVYIIEMFLKGWFEENDIKWVWE